MLDTRHYKEMLEQELKECMDDPVCPKNVEYINAILKTMRGLSIVDAGESELHRSAVSGIVPYADTDSERSTKSVHSTSDYHREMIGLVDDLKDDVMHYFTESKENREGMNYGASVKPILEGIEDLIECIYDHSDRRNRDEIKSVLRSMRHKHAI